MAQPNRILALNLGTQNITAAEFQAGATGGITLAKFATRELYADPAMDSSRSQQTKVVVGELVEEIKAKGQKVNYAISAQQVFTRFVKLPPVEASQVEQIVGFEAQQNVPYPIDEVTWDYQLIDMGDGSAIEVVLAAMKSDLLDEVNDSVESNGVKTNVVDVSPMALYNAYRYNYSDLDGCTLIVDIGARTANLVFIEPHKVFSRSIPIGGAKVTEAIAKDFGEPFTQAEERKKRDGFVSLGGTYADPDDPEIARVSKMIRNTMTRLHQEIVRSVSFYRSNQEGSAPDRVFLSGGGVSMPYTKEFFQEKFSNIPVEFFNPLRNVAVGSGVNTEQLSAIAHTLGESVGLALRSSTCPMEINLRPKSVKERQRAASMRPAVALVGVSVVAAMAAWWLYNDSAAKHTQSAASSLETKINVLKGPEGQMSSIRNQIKSKEDAIAPLVEAINDRQYWSSLFDDLNARLPADNIWIVGYSFISEKDDTAATATKSATAKSSDKQQATKTGTKLVLKAWVAENANSAAPFDEFVAALKQSPFIEEVIDKATSDKTNGYVRNTESDGKWILEQQVPVILKNPIKLK